MPDLVKTGSAATAGGADLKERGPRHALPLLGERRHDVDAEPELGQVALLRVNDRQ
jgi:hypothetical protein